jgi:hypothetical protein
MAARWIPGSPPDTTCSVAAFPQGHGQTEDTNYTLNAVASVTWHWALQSFQYVLEPKERLVNVAGASAFQRTGSAWWLHKQSIAFDAIVSFSGCLRLAAVAVQFMP